MNNIMKFLRGHGILLTIIVICVLVVFTFIYAPLLHSARLPTLAGIKNLGESLQPFVEILAIIIAGVWTYLLFIKNRVDYPIAEIHQEISQWAFDKDHFCLSVIISIKNIGKVLIRLKSSLVFVQQITPLLPDLKLFLENAKDEEIKEGAVKGLFCDNQQQIAWREIGYRKKDLSKENVNIDPGETEEFQYEFILNNGVHSVRVESYFRNIKYSNSNIGWRKTNIYNILEKKT